nr:seipin-1 isoform X2 [Ipomoea batatas]
MNSPIAGPGTDREDELADAAKEARNLSEWFSKRGTLQAETVSACLSALSSPLLSRRRLFGSEPDRTAENDTSEIGGGGSGGLARKIGVGILAAAYVGMIPTILLVVAAILGVAVVRVWVEEPVLLKERLNFDYTDAQPKAVFSFVHRGCGEYNSKFVGKSKKMGVPAGHTFYVSLVLVMPESDYNIELGIFQVYSNPNSQFRKSLIFFLLPLSWRLGVPTAATRVLSEAAATNRRGPRLVAERRRSTSEEIPSSLRRQASSILLD